MTVPLTQLSFLPYIIDFRFRRFQFRRLQSPADRRVLGERRDLPSLALGGALAANYFGRFTCNAIL